MRISKAAKVNGTLLERRHGWIRPASGKGRLVGVWVTGFERIMMDEDGRMFTEIVRSGICVRGPASIRGA
jgi:hypothetical protein